MKTKTIVLIAATIQLLMPGCGQSDFVRPLAERSHSVRPVEGYYFDPTTGETRAAWAIVMEDAPLGPAPKRK